MRTLTIAAVVISTLISRGPSITKRPLVFIAYGISEPDHGWDDIKGTDLKGKVEVMVLGVPERDGKAALPADVHKTYQGVPGSAWQVPPLRRVACARGAFMTRRPRVRRQPAIPL